MRLVEVFYGGKWYRFLSNELDAERLPTAYLAALYQQRRRIEDAYATVSGYLHRNGPSPPVFLQAGSPARQAKDVAIKLYPK